jgi:hypothetical protein
VSDRAVVSNSGMGRAWWHASLLLVCVVLLPQRALSQTRQSGRGASVALTAKWNSTATVLEAAEFLVSPLIHLLQCPVAECDSHAPTVNMQYLEFYHMRCLADW